MIQDQEDRFQQESPVAGVYGIKSPRTATTHRTLPADYGLRDTGYGLGRQRFRLPPLGSPPQVIGQSHRLFATQVSGRREPLPPIHIPQ
jgi:hypothetical protein